MVWFSSDFHFGHAAIVDPSKTKKGFRYFESVEEMNKTLIETINKYVKEDDILYFLGDFCFGGHKNTPQHRSLIKCKTIHVCRGNHDHHLHKYSEHFTSINDVTWYREASVPIFMSHYSHRVWEGSHKGFIHLYGHSHDSLPPHGKSIDVAVDVAFRMVGEYRPFSLDEVLMIMANRKVKIVDHHKPDTNVR
jgi:calcineurin-like phosphoesterase family protein